jgi:hypothetical protein
MMLTYKNKEWGHQEDLVEWGDKSDEEALKAAGFGHTENFGCEFGFSYEVYTSFEKLEWIVVFSTPHNCETIFVDRWSDLIDLLAYLAPISIAASSRDLPGHLQLAYRRQVARG